MTDLSQLIERIEADEKLRRCVLCGGSLVPVRALDSVGCTDCGSTFTLDGLAAYQRAHQAKDEA
ncbi:hypothetical protein [Sphingopyxis indica]|uniref:Uncharacterized protein n=1 Tax=Sphingopyxis indica TaxID=436663 RepID=A0A239H4W6_9SPHN|nr:hypothetical protein [Sphingopyxis indica]SNS76058.1 hypothetical protein SAMN06295955_104235 [Sphingopyxis indica]